MNKYLWFSRRDSFGHLYIYDNQKDEIKLLTKGNYTVERIVGIDSVLSQIYFTAFGKEENLNPYYRHQYSLNYKTNKLNHLTPENANHEIYLSPDNRYLVDVFSRIDKPHKSILRNLEGKKLMNIEEADTQMLFDNGWGNPEIFKVKQLIQLLIYGV